MNARKVFLITVLLLLSMARPAFAFPPQSVEFLPGYKFPDSASNGAPVYQLRYFVYFPSWYLGAGVGIGSIRSEANNLNLAIDSKLTVRPMTFALKLIPPHRRSLIPYFEIGIDRLSRLHYQLDPAVDTGAGDSCPMDPQIPSLCKITTFKRISYGYHIGAGAETVFKSGLGLGVHYTYLFARPLERIIQTSVAQGVSPFSTLHEDIFKLNESILSLLMSYHFN